MIIDARQVPSGDELSADLCIVGAGAAGITLARDLNRNGLRICLLESGGFEFDNRTQALYQGVSSNPAFYPLDATRLRYFGGSTNHWNGFCRPLEPVDFAERNYIPKSGWPFGREALDPFYTRACEICELSATSFTPEHWAHGENRPFALAEDGFRTTVFQNGPPTRFGKVYRDDIEKAEGIKAYLHANVVEIETPDTPNQVTRLHVATLGGGRFTVRARVYVLATGGIENVRLLLSSDKVQKAGLGNDHDLVGRYFLDHPEVRRSGSVLFQQHYPELRFYDFNTTEGTNSYRGAFLPSRELLDRERLPNFYLALSPGDTVDLSEGAASLQSILSQVKHGHMPHNIGKHLANVLSDLGGVADYAYGRFVEQDVPVYTITYNCEVAPNPDSRISLIDERDELGMRRVKVDWRVGEDFEENYLRAHRLFAEEIGRTGLGRVKINTRDSALNPMALYQNGHHHMGATRMHPDPKQGVVDANCRVHGLSNLYVAGSSVFPTAGCGTPTLTIVAMTLRLAEHLQGADGPLTR